MSILSRFKQAAAVLTISFTGIFANTVFAHEEPEDNHTHFDNSQHNTSDVCLRGDEPYIVVNMDDGTVIDAHRERELIQTASMAKPMAHIVAFDAINAGDISLRRQVRISDSSIDSADNYGGNVCDLKNNADVYPELNVQNALAASAVRSCNDVTVALMKDVVELSFPSGRTIPNREREGFAVAAMNNVAEHLNMDQTNVTNVSGLPDPGNHTTLVDLTKLYLHIHEEQPDVKALLSMESTGIRKWNKGNTLTIMRSKEAEVRTFWGKTGSVNPERGGSGWFVVSEKTDGPNIGIGTVCHPLADAQNFHIRQQFTLALLHKAENILENSPGTLSRAEVIDWRDSQNSQSNALSEKPSVSLH